MNQTSLRSALPYFTGLIVATALYYFADHIAYTPRGGELGPDFWPKLAIGLMAAACVVEIVRAFARASGTRGIAEMLEQGEEIEGPSHWPLLIGGIALLSAYALLVGTLGFLLATFLFIAAFMYLGRYRYHLAIWTISVVATVLIGFLFLRFAYVSLPRGEPPFDRFTDFIRIILGG
jgi:putative tricarboxylic transport membrane protein